MDSIHMTIFGLMAAVGKMELDNFRERASMGKRGKAKQGRMPNGSVPYGYRTGADGKPEIHEPEAEVVRRIFRQYVHEGMVGMSIARQLATGQCAHVEAGFAVAQRLRLRFYWGRRSTRAPGGTARPAGLRLRAETRCSDSRRRRGSKFHSPPLVDEQTWDRAQAIKKDRTSLSKRNTKIFYLLQHLLRCAECGLLFACRSKTRKTVKRKDKTYSYDYRSPQRHYHCYGMQREHLRCRERPYIRGRQVGGTRFWSEVKKVVQNPDLIREGIESLDTQEDGGLAKRSAGAERELRRVQKEEERAIGLRVSGKITEDQFDHQRKLVHERLEAARAKLDDYRAQESLTTKNRILMENIVDWTAKVGDGLDNLSSEDRREVLRLIVDQIVIDRDNRVSITLGIPSEDLVSFEKEASRTT